MCIFFIKQKTAYEMRISDWSSDVCSSDLDAKPGSGEAGGEGGNAAHEGSPAGETDARRRRGMASTSGGETQRVGPARPQGARGASSQSVRQCVVSGKGVSVPLHLGGRRILIIKTHLAVRIRTTYCS